MVLSGFALALRGGRVTEASHRLASLVPSMTASLMAAVLLAAGAAGTVDYYLTGLALNQVTARAFDHVDLGVAPYVSPYDFEPPYTLTKLEEIEARLEPLLARARRDGSGIIRLNLYAPDGTILYSDLPSLRGQVVSPLADALIRSALAGSPGAAMVSLGGTATADLQTEYGSALEACVPLILDGHVVGLYALYEDPGPVYALRPLVWGLAAFVALTFVLLLRSLPPMRARPETSQALLRPRGALEHDLTRREIEVLHLLAQGCTYRVIGERLVISEETVRSHVKSILHKLHQPNRVRAVAAAREAGII